MELRAEVKLRNKETGSETILCTNVSADDALKWVNFSLKTMDYNAMPEYVIRPMIAGRESKNGNVAAAKQV